MNSKTRVLNTFNRIKSDRVPIDYSVNPTIHAKIEKHLGVSDYESVLKAFNVDFRGLYIPFVGKNIYPEIVGRNVNPVYGFYTRWVKNDFGGYEDFCDYPLQNVSEQVINSFPVPSADGFDYSHVFEQCNSNKDYAVYVGDPGMSDIINATGRVMGMEDTLMNLITEDEATIDYINRRCNMELEKLERIIVAGKGLIDFFWMGEDLGTQNSPMIGLDLYKKVLKPFHKKYVDLAKSYNLPVMVHTCGSSSWVYEDLIDLGVDAVDTLQPEATNMNPKYLVDHFGGRLSFHGCISTAGALAYGSIDDLEKQISETLEIMKPTYSYMLAPTHAIQDNSPIENVIAMFRLAEKLGKY